MPHCVPANKINYELAISNCCNEVCVTLNVHIHCETIE